MCRVTVDVEPDTWIHDGARQFQARMIVGVHMKEGGHRGVRAILARIRPYCWWMDTEVAMQEFVGQCLHFSVSRSGAVVPLPLAASRHGAVIGEALHSDHLH